MWKLEVIGSTIVVKNADGSVIESRHMQAQKQSGDQIKDWAMKYFRVLNPLSVNFALEDARKFFS